MFANLNPNMVGVNATLPQAIDFAAQHGFAGIDFSIAEAAQLARLDGVSAVADLFASHSVRPGSWGLPVDFRRDEATWRDGLLALPAQAALAAELGCLRTATWIMPCDNERDFRSNFAFHVARLKPIAAILADHGIRFGLEFVGPATLRHSRRFSFLHTLDGMLVLAASVGENTGLLLDIFHLYTAHGSNDDLRQISGQDVVVVHVNDAIAGLSADEQIDQTRALPGETGVLDLAGFLHALRDIGYDGPITAEPFSQRLRDLPAEQAIAETADAMRKIGLM